MIDAQLLLKIAAILYAPSLGAAIFSGRLRHASWFFLAPALLANGAAVLMRYRTAWPMLPMYLGPVALPAALGVMLPFIQWRSGEETRTPRFLLAFMTIIAMAAVFFPKDFYLPFLKSQTIWAHLFLLFGVAGKACFLASSAWALESLTGNYQSPAPTPVAAPFTSLRASEDCRAVAIAKAGSPLPPTVSDPRPPSTSPATITGPSSRSASLHRRSIRWAAWGFSFWTLSMFAGELWSHQGWGTPVVWDDPAITTIMATWFFYICLLHLHLTGSWTPRGRCVYAAAGGLVVLTLNVTPDLGPFRWPL